MSETKIYSWFLGPKAENAELLEKMILEAVRDCVFWRRNFHPEDEILISEQVKRKDDFQDSVALLQQSFQELLAKLKRDIPFYSPRYIGHMLGEQLLPAILGYMAAMLHNPNNVSAEASPITTEYELEVARQLARISGWTGDTWGHITSGGTIANLEALWIARNVKFLPLALYDMAKEHALDEVGVELSTGEHVALTTLEAPWPLLNITTTAALDLEREVYTHWVETQTSLGQPSDDFAQALLPHTLSGKGLLRFFTEREASINPPVLLVPATAHYSLAKIAEVLGIGQEQVLCIPVTRDFQIDPHSLRALLEECLQNKRPVIACVSVLGTTEEGAIDPIDEVAAIRDEFRARGLDFHFHIDAAWGGYTRTLLYDEYDQLIDTPRPIVQAVRNWPSEKVFARLQAVPHGDSITIDPHKLGYIPYPCGVIAFKDARVKELVAFEAPYIGDHREEETRPILGRYILEGSKPGASAASCWLAHKVVPLNLTGYGQLIGKTLQGTQELYLKCLQSTVKQLKEEGVIMHFVTAPPNLNLLCFLLNIEGNDSLQQMNAFNQAVYNEFCFRPEDVVQQHGYIISRTQFTYEKYGKPCSDGKHSMVDHLAALGIPHKQFEQVKQIMVLRSTIISPWLSLARGSRSDYVEGFVSVLKEKVLELATTFKGA